MKLLPRKHTMKKIICNSPLENEGRGFAMELKFGERIREVRKNAGCSQKEFCALLDIPQSTLSAYETDRMQPTVASLINIATKFNVSLDWLCGIEKTAPRFGTMGEVKTECNAPFFFGKDYMNNTPRFTGRNVPTEEIANTLAIPVDVIECAIVYGDLKFGTAIRQEGTTYYICPDKKVWEETGYFKEG